MTKAIQEALRQLDPNNENHWTADGLPRLDTVKLLAGDSGITREHVTAAAPGYTRSAALGGAEPGSGMGTPSPAQETAPAAPQAPSQGVGNGAEQAGSGADDGTQVQKATARAEAEGPVAVAQRVYDAALAAKEAADRELAQATAALDLCIEAQQQAGGTSTLADAVTGYHAQQQAQREEQAARRNALKGVNLKDILPTRAKIDEALARRTGFGNRRPTQV
jgi:hypothetical protein